jgi:hypothetical protein
MGILVTDIGLQELTAKVAALETAMDAMAPFSMRHLGDGLWQECEPATPQCVRFFRIQDPPSSHGPPSYDASPPSRSAHMLIGIGNTSMQDVHVRHVHDKQKSVTASTASFKINGKLHVVHATTQGVVLGPKLYRALRLAIVERLSQTLVCAVEDGHTAFFVESTD